MSAVGLVVPAITGSQTQAAMAANRTRVLFTLPKSDDRRIAWTVDDGFSDETIVAFIRRLRDNPELRVTFFVTSSAAPWSRHAKAIRELVEAGQVQVANHTRTHAALTRLKTSKIIDELSSCQKFLEDKFGVSGESFYRPPYGYYDDRVRSVAADLGYTDTVMWLGTLADAGKNTQAGIYRNAEKWMKNGRIVISHANYPMIIKDLDPIISLLARRELQTVTLNDAFS